MLLPPVNAELTLDAKGRVMLPRALRSALELQGVGGLVAFANGGPGGGVAFCRVEDFDELRRSYTAGNPVDPKARLFARAVASTASMVKVDGAGRMVIPGTLRGMLGIEKDLYLFVGGGWFEIWDRARWLERGFAEAAVQWERFFGTDSLQPVGGEGV